MIEESRKQNITMIIEEPEIEVNRVVTPPLTTENIIKKRGRKPKGGKLIINNSIKSDAPPSVTNIILHLKCSMQDLIDHNQKTQQTMSDPLTYNPTIPPVIMTYNDTDKTQFSVYNKGEGEPVAYTETDADKTKPCSNPTLCDLCSTKIEDSEDVVTDSRIQTKELYAKLKQIKIQLYKNGQQDKKSACFWCTYDFDNPACYIPKFEIDKKVHGYGSFCRPECAAAFLMEEIIDDSTKFERYHLLNQIYGKIYDYKKNIKPAPNPYYLLDKFYGNLSIQEYRKLLKSDHMFLVIDKPMTRILPELHEDRDDFITNIYGGSSQIGNNSSSTSNTGIYKVKRQSEKKQGPSKTEIMKESFGF
uniref:MYM-type domain-containing protein n=1 Tax=viral metagenome TaxID=1070528 RepID=A0A6C0I593_9ZZZZ